MEQMTTHIGIEPGQGLVGRFGDTVILIPRGEAEAGSDEAARELLDLAAAVASDRQVPAGTIAARLAAWVIGRLPADALAFGIVVPVRDGVVMFLRGAVWCTVTEGGSTRELSGEQALTWVDQIVPGTFERLAIGSAADRPVRADPLSDLRDGVVPGQGFVLTRAGSIPGQEPSAAGTSAASAAGTTGVSEAAAASEAADASGTAAVPRRPTCPGPEPGLGRPEPSRMSSRGRGLRTRPRGRRPTRRPPRSPRPRSKTTSRPCWCRPARTPRRPPGTSPPGPGRPTRPGRPHPRWWSRFPAPRCRLLARRWRHSRRWAC